MGRLGHTLLLGCLLLRATAWGGEWTVVKYGGRDHVTVRNVADFYNLGEYQRASSSLVLGTPGRSLRGTVGSNELYINNLKFILSYPIEEMNGEPIISRMDLTKVIEPVLRPSRIQDAAVIDSVVLDPGHGGHDNGAASFFGNEKTYTLDVAYRAKALLEAQGLRVFMTRTSDEFIPLEERVQFANAHPSALFIAIHFNSGGTEANGIETYTLAPRGVPSMAADGPMLSDLRPCAGNIRDAENMALACATHASLISHSRLFDRGIKRARFVVIRDITIPGVLVEGGFLSNPNDARLIATAEYREEEAQCIAIAIRNYRNAVNTPAQLTMAGRSVGVRDDVDVSGEVSAASARALPPIGEQPAVRSAPDVEIGPATASQPTVPAPSAPVATPQATPAALAAPADQSSGALVPSTSHSMLTPIVD